MLTPEQIRYPKHQDHKLQSQR